MTDNTTKTCTHCDTTYPLKEFTKKGGGKYRSICKPCDNAKRTVRRVKANETPIYSLDWYKNRYELPEAYDQFGNRTNKIEFTNGDTWTAVGQTHLHGLASMPGLPEYMRIHLAAMSRLTPSMAAYFEPGELAAVTGISTSHINRALAACKQMGLTDELSTTTKVWICPDEAQVRNGDYFDGNYDERVYRAGDYSADELV